MSPCLLSALTLDLLDPDWLGEGSVVGDVPDFESNPNSVA